MPGKSKSFELQEILDNLPHMTSEELEAALSRLSEEGITSPEGPLYRPGITCPFTDMQVISPCSLSKCKFHVENEWAKNCLLQYLDNQNSESLASEEIAFLYQTTTEKVNNVIEGAMSQLRENSEETVGIEGDFKKLEPKKFKVSIDSSDEINITSSTLSPPFLGDLNRALKSFVSDELVLKHPSVKLLGVLDSIISELE